MSAVRGHRDDEAGFSLVELLAALLVGMIVFMAAFGLLDVVQKSRARTSDRVAAVGPGRLAMEQITRVVRSQLCVSAAQPALLEATPTKLTIIGSLSGDPTYVGASPTATAGDLRYEQRTIEFVPITPQPAEGARWRVVERLYPYVSTGVNSEGVRVMTFAAAPSRTRTIADRVAAPSRSEANGRFFRYWRFTNTGTEVAPVITLQELTATPLELADRARVVQVGIGFDAYAPGIKDAKLRTAFYDRVVARTADRSQPNLSPICR